MSGSAVTYSEGRLDDTANRLLRKSATAMFTSGMDPDLEPQPGDLDHALTRKIVSMLFVSGSNPRFQPRSGDTIQRLTWKWGSLLFNSGIPADLRPRPGDNYQRLLWKIASILFFSGDYGPEFQPGCCQADEDQRLLWKIASMLQSETPTPPEPPVPPPEFYWEPASASISWQDSGGFKTGNLAAFKATAIVSDVGEIYASSAGVTDFHNLNLLPALYFLACDDNPLTALDVTGCVSLVALDCFLCPVLANIIGLPTCASLAVIDASSNPSLLALDVHGLLSLLNAVVSNDPAMVSFNASGCVSFVGTAGFMDLSVGMLSLSTINLDGTAIFSVFCAGGAVSSFTAVGAPTLFGIVCSGNVLTALDFSTNLVMDSISCDSNPITDLRIGNSPAYLVVEAENCALPTSGVLPAEGVNEILLRLEANCLFNIGFCDLSGGTSGAPSGAAVAAVANLWSQGWFVVTN